jgi:hypothetical protein
MTTTIEQPKTPTQQRIEAVEPGEFNAPDCLESKEAVEPVVEPGFRVTNEAAASWVVRHVVAARDRAERAKAWAAREVAQAERDEAFFMARFGGELEDWLRSVLDTKRKSIDLPAGRVGVRTSPARLVVTDEEKALAWARSHQPSAVVAVPASEHLSRQDLILKFKQTGEIPDGADLQPVSASLYIR